jgi:hypothetical protein
MHDEKVHNLVYSNLCVCNLKFVSDYFYANCLTNLDNNLKVQDLKKYLKRKLQRKER